MTNYKYFSTYETKMTDKQKKILYEEFKVKYSVGDISMNDFFQLPGIFEMVSMKCLNCEAELNVSFLFYKPAMDAGMAAFPMEDCMRCETYQLVPKEIFDKLNK